MITGTVNTRLEAVVEILVRGPEGAGVKMEAVIDTGYDGALTLPRRLVDELRLPFDSRARAEMADGREVLFDLHEATVVWSGRAHDVLIDVAETEPLMGTALLAGRKLCVEFKARGDVTVEPLA